MTLSDPFEYGPRQLATVMGLPPHSPLFQPVNTTQLREPQSRIAPFHVRAVAALFMFECQDFAVCASAQTTKIHTSILNDSAISPSMVVTTIAPDPVVVTTIARDQS